MASLGAKLRLERERQKLALEKIADDTRISYRYLEAIEADDQSSLPGDFFYRAFVRQYSKYLGWNPDEIEQQINLVSSIPTSEPGVSNVSPAAPDPQINALRETLKGLPMRPPQDDGTPRTWLVFAALVILACSGYFAWRNFKPETSATTTAASVAAPPPVLASTPEPVKQDPAPVTSAAVAATTPPPAPSDGKFSVTIRAREMTWIRFIADGNRVHGGPLEAGQERTVNASQVELLVGNCGTLDVIYNGKPISCGTRGEVKTLLMNSEGWKFKPKPVPASDSAAPPTTPGSTSGAVGQGLN
jgi:cytoskeletal protein RodZ